ncbi:MAG: beta-N-acetylhexosaminidase [Rhodospirillaceae bacterium]
MSQNPPAMKVSSPTAPPAAGIFGCAGLTLTAWEKAFFRDVRPFGFILFARNVDTPDQVKALCQALREATDRPEAVILIDQEGGRVRRLKPPHWRNAPPMGLFGQLYGQDPERAIGLCRDNARLIGLELAGLGIDTDCLPLLDLPIPGAHDIIGDRAFAASAEPVIALGRAVLEGLGAAGVFPVIKHIPGHGRAVADSHLALPVVDTDRQTLEQTDFAPFAALADAPFAMTAHILYKALDAERPATLSPSVIEKGIRQKIGFDGLLMCDDLSMKALGGAFEDRTRLALEAGCDLVLHCNGNQTEMTAIANTLRPLDADGLRRAEAAQRWRAKAQDPGAEDFDPLQAEADVRETLAQFGWSGSTAIDPRIGTGP